MEQRRCPEVHQINCLSSEMESLHAAVSGAAIYDPGLFCGGGDDGGRIYGHIPDYKKTGKGMGAHFRLRRAGASEIMGKSRRRRILHFASCKIYRPDRALDFCRPP